MKGAGNFVIWLDVTDLQNWHGEFTGVQRVVAEFAKRTSQEEVEFFSFDGSEFNRVKRGTLSLIAKNPPPVATQSARGRSFSRLRHRVRAIRDTGRQFLLSFLPASTQLALRAWAMNSKAKKDRRALRHCASPFVAGDTLLFFGASWSSSSLRAIPLANVQEITIVSLVHDMIPRLFPHFFGPGFADYYSGHMAEVLQLSDRILTNSQSSRIDILAFADELGLEAPPIDVIRLGDDGASRSRTSAPLKPEQGINREFVLCVGTLEIRKNYNLLCDVWSLAIQNGIPVPLLVIVGREGWLTADLQYRINNDPVLQQNVRWIRSCPDEQLSWLYQNCLLTMYPSHYEGWGLPIAESLSYGKVCISSSTSSMPEIAGDLIPYVNNYDVHGTLQIVVDLVKNKTKRAALEAKIKKHYRGNTWDDSFREMWDSVSSAHSKAS